MTTATGNAAAEHKSKKGRSPSYPNIPLDTAVQRAAQLYDVERRNLAPITAIQGAWGYKPNSGPANMAVAALKKYGLLRDAGSGSNRMAQLTELGYEVVNQPDPKLKAEAIRQAALTPPIHQQLWAQYSETGLPSDATLLYELETNRAFTRTGAQEFVQQFRKTVAFADLPAAKSSVDMSDGEEPDDYDEPPGAADQTRPNAGVRRRRHRFDEGSGKVLSIPVPIAGGTAVVVEGQFPITEASWDQFIAVLQAMKPGLVTDDDEA